VYHLDHDKDVQGRQPASLCLAEPCMPVPHSFIPYLEGSERLVLRSIFLNPMLTSLQVAMGALCSRLGSLCINPPRLLSLEMTAAVTGSSLSSSVNRVCKLHTSSLVGQLLQARAVQSNVIAFYQGHFCAVRAGSTSISNADVGTSPVGQPLPRPVPSSQIFST
jgi:hypothetical protein